MQDLEIGPPIERTWVVWHALIGLGAGLLFIPSAGPPFIFILCFLTTAMVTLLGVRAGVKSVVMLGLVGLAVTQTSRAAVIWRAESVGAGSRFVATFLWGMLAVGALMETYAVKNRGIR